MSLEPAPASLPPVGRFLSNGSFVALVSARGSGFVALDRIAITRWSADALADAGGFEWTVRDLESGAAMALHRASHEPASVEAAPGRWIARQERDGLAARMTCWVDPAASAELRAIEIANLGARTRAIDLTSYAELVLQPAAADAAHPVFSKLFVQTEWMARAEALCARRRPRGTDESFPCVLHALDGPGAIGFESDRARFLGRGRFGAPPAALAAGGTLSGTAGNVLDPALSLRRATSLAPGASARWTSLLACGAGADDLRDLLERFRRPAAIETSLAAASAAESARRREAGLGDDEADAAHDFLTALARRDGRLRESAPAGRPSPLSAAVRAALGIDAARWLVVADAGSPAGEAAARRLVRVSRFARALGLPIRLVVLSRDRAAWPDGGNEAGDVTVVDPASLDPGRLAALGAHARAWVAEPPGTPESVAPELGEDGDVDAVFAPLPSSASTERGAGEPLEDFNGLGGFTKDGSEYVIRLAPTPGGGLALPPQPWVNVMANPGCGALASETGAGFTWSGNSREHRLTPWLNDPVLDPHAEALYLRDESSGRVWSPQPGPVPCGAPYEVRHRPGASTWSVNAHGLSQRTTVFVPPDAGVKLTRIEIANHGDAARRVRIVSYQRLVLGAAAGEPGVVTRCDAALGVVFAENPLSADFGSRVAWISAAAPAAAELRVGDDRRAFLGARGRVERPAALARGAAPAVATRGDLDPAAVVEVTIEIPAGEARTCTFLLGEAAGVAEAALRLAEFRAPGAVDRALAAALAAWETLGARLRIRTPEPAIDRMVNHWLPYQNLSCRIWGRSAFYQSGGAFGFRDQLQDSSALVWLRPDLAREQILLHAAHQFEEGDVLHWWHPPRSRGIRTRFADDLLWLPWIAAFYVSVTGDAAVLDEVAPFLTAPALDPGEQERYLEPADSGRGASVYEHAARAIDRSLATGAHGLPHFGCGDWNDGMNRVGHDGRGESVWMAFFLHAAIASFAPHAERRGDAARLARWRAHQRALEAALEAAGWDGAWYRRGYYGDGAPLGSSASDECRIDALAQAWAVISRAVPRERAEAAMRSADQQLVSEADRLVRLLVPPFEHTPHDPGYIKGYVPGVRENGGQYTHAALWVVRAMAELGWRHRAARTLAMLSPVAHARDAAAVATYRVEPYVIAADVYGAEPHVGRGGWTWYTGSAGWMFRVAVESILGLGVEDGEWLRLSPCLPDEWPEAEIEWTVPGHGTRLRIRYRSPDGCAAGVRSATLDGAAIEPAPDGTLRIALPRDGAVHAVEVVLGPGPEPAPRP